MLKNMEITSIDLVEQGANQDANIEIIKRKENTVQEDIKGLLEQIAKALDVDTETEVVEETAVDESVQEEVLDEVVEEEVEKSVDVESIIKGYESKLSKIQKDNEAIKKANEDLKKSLEVKELIEIAKKYEPIGEDKVELAKKLYDYKKSNEAYYNDYLALLDKALTMQNESGLFDEFGTAMSGQNATDLDEVFKSYDQRADRPANYYEQAAIDHPELLAEYDRKYRG